MKPKQLFPIFFGFDILLFDLLTKYFADRFLNEPIFILPSFLTLELHKNSGIAFSIPLPPVVQILASAVLLFLLFLYAKHNTKHAFEHFCISAIVSGALGNLVERVLFGVVTDFISVWNFPVFNLADTAIFLGVLGLICFEFLYKKNKPKNHTFG